MLTVLTVFNLNKYKIQIKRFFVSISLTLFCNDIETQNYNTEVVIIVKYELNDA